MSTHWTYCTPANYSDLQQGDIIGRKDELLEVLKGVHSYFCDERYTAFLVLTQSCDLVRRKRGECKARHISLATIREMDQVLPSMIQELSGSRYQSILLRERKSVAEEFLERLIDQNEQARGLFYLHPAADAGIAVASLAFLRVTITLRQEHYDISTSRGSSGRRVESAQFVNMKNLRRRMATDASMARVGSWPNAACIVYLPGGDSSWRKECNNH